MIKHAIALFLLLGCALPLLAQYNDGMQHKTFASPKDSLLLDTNTIVVGSIRVLQNQQPLTEGVHFRINYWQGYFIPLQLPTGTSLQITYQVLNIYLKTPVLKKSRTLQIPQLNGSRYDQGYTATNNSRLDIFKQDDLKLNGSISRGLGFGNNQDVVLNGNLNLQMAGTLNNDIDVLAAITDDNNPVQPEGNTQQLQDFDRVFVQLSKAKTTLTVGDFEMNRPQGGYFMNYYKKSRGAQFSTALKSGKNGLFKVGGEGALSRGRFSRNTINGIEGNQGPYRLSGTNGELFIIIISGTEAVFLDGQKLTRGEQNDYVIDYNTGEITFMPKRPITQYSRIVVEFQFSDRNYARSVFHLNTDYESTKYKIRFNYFTEQDNKNQPFLQTLTDSSKKILAAVGDNTSSAVISSENKTTFDAKKILYRKIDSLGYTGIYVYTPTQGTDSVFYEVRFSLVGNGKGNYKQSISGANGRVFNWVEPINGIPQGDYEPVILLISPKRNQMLTVGTEITAIKNTTISVEAANTFNDKNTFSTVDKGNDAGYGFKASINNTSNLFRAKNSNLWQLKTNASYEFVDQHFRYVERYRNVEFDRTWNRLLTNQNQPADTGFEEHITSLRAAIGNGNANEIYYQLGLYNKKGQFNGLQHLAGVQLHQGKNNMYAEAEWLSTANKQSNNQKSDVSRYRLEYNRNIWKLLAGVKTERERSYFTTSNDSLLSGSYGYDQYGVFLRNTDSNALRYRVEYTNRVDFLPRNSELTQSTVGQNMQAGLDLVQQNGNRLSVNFTYREFIIKDPTITQLKPEQTILSRIEYDYGFLRRVFLANTYYQVGKGQELRRDFQYVEVLVGQGQYVWKDFNNDGAQQLNEFVLAGLADRPQANYIRVFLPTNSFISTNLNQFNQTLNINPAAVWGNKKGMRKVVSKFNNQTALRFDRKTTELDTRYFLNPFYLNVNDTSLISLNSLLRNTLFFNRSNATFGADFSYQNQRSKTFLTNGFESRDRTEQSLNTRWNLNTTWSINTGVTVGQRIYTSDFFSINNFNYTFTELKPRLVFQLNAQLRITAIFSYFEAQNKVELGNQKATNKEIGTELRYSLAKQGVLNGRLSYYQITFNGDAQSQLGYDMLQGLNTGQNSVWNINYQQRLGNNLQITINYDGRSAENQRTIHVGRMEARYLF